MHYEAIGRRRFWKTQTKTYTNTHKHTHGLDELNIMPFRHLWRKLFSANCLIILLIFAKCCQSISKGFRVTDLNSMVDARAGVNVDGRTYERMENRIPILHHPRGMSDNKDMSRTRTDFTEAYAQTVSANCNLDL